MKKLIIVVVLFSLVLAGCSKPARSPEGKTEAAALEPYDSLYLSLKASLQSGNHHQALGAIKSMKEAIWDQAPLALENARFVKNDNNSYGIYEPEEDYIFSYGEPIYLYIEPTGFTIIKNEAGYYEFGFLADFQLADENGEILGGQQNFARLPFKSWNRNTEIALTFTFNFRRLESGKYKIIITISDMYSKKKATSENWFMMR